MASVTVDNVTATATADATAVVTLEGLIRERVAMLRQGIALSRGGQPEEQAASGPETNGANAPTGRQADVKR